MTKKRLIIFIPFLMFLIISCSVETPTPEEAPEIEVITLQIIPSLTHWLPDVADCAEKIPDFGIYTEILTPSELSLDEADIVLSLGERRETDPFVAVMGTEEIVVIAGSGVPISSLSVEQLQSIYAGSITNWGEIPGTTTTGQEIDQAIVLLSYPEGHLLRDLFVKSYLTPNTLSRNIQIFSIIAYLEEVLEDNPFAIAYALRSQAPRGVQMLNVTDIDPMLAHHFVLAVTPSEPQGKLRTLLLCLQESQ